jgi:Uma2 family endonuclease
MEPMAVQVPSMPLRARRQVRWRFTADQYLALCDTGFIPPDQHTELIEGEIFVVPTPGPLHASCQMALTRLFMAREGDRFVVWTENAVRLGDDSVVRPDVALLRPEPNEYCLRVPNVSDVLLAVEVANTSLSHDRRRKLPLYARHGVPEVWLVSLPERRLEVHRDPHGRRYREMMVHGDGERVAPMCAPAVAVDVGNVLRVRFREGGEQH